METSRILKWVTGGIELFLGIPIIGGLIIFGTGYLPLQIMLVVHIIALIASIYDKQKKSGNILGIITSVVGYIPVVGMFMHILTGIWLIVEAFSQQNEKEI
ncbi:hypothetical protein CHL76_01000 [Marinococcus halophilus]|uniref:Uncharacterized protein n=1 Tax=Marinococcus halophilus TaxID=1371 RepID=A0A510Y546_MARHA|nr:hypothetical protein [Marinococcus halophilus]OZT81704.1 hypothetical protein CHL76_01000 [Marinococcus halophilus]GEK57657.1 hypothetical protein MHA01_05620 [Marinococcus halophilus]